MFVKNVPMPQTECGTYYVHGEFDKNEMRRGDKCDERKNQGSSIERR